MNNARVNAADRIAAAAITVLSEMRDLILAGKADHHAEPFAVHRLAAYDDGRRAGYLAGHNHGYEAGQNEPPIYCPVCGSCGDEGCGCLSKCLYPPVSPLEDSERPTIYVRFSDDGERIRKWAFIPFDDGVRYSPEPRKDTQP